VFAIADGLARYIAPVLPVLAEEFWGHLPGAREESVHLAQFPTEAELLVDPTLIDRWSRLLKLRGAVNAELEKLRQSKAIGQSLEAVVHLKATGAIAGLIDQYRDQLPGLFITSQVDERTDAPVIGQEPADGAVFVESDGSAVHIVAARADGVKCDRCWRYVPAVNHDVVRAFLAARGAAEGTDPGGVCPRCEDALAGAK
jgi:isoleucyl-tRNA synthetase